MLTRKTVLAKIKHLYENKTPFCVALKVVKDESETAENGHELRLVPLVFDTARQYEYTRRYVKVMYETDGTELQFNGETLATIDIIGSHTEEEGQAKIKQAIEKYSKAHGFGKVMTESELIEIATDCLNEANDERTATA